MVKNIILHLNDEMFKRMKQHKLKIQAEMNNELTWEAYTAILFGFAKLHNGNRK